MPNPLFIAPAERVQDPAIRTLDRLPFQLQVARQALGDPMLRAGRQRLRLAGTFTSARAGSNAVPIAVVRDLPNLVRVEIGARSIGKDARGAWATNGRVNDVDREVLDMLQDNSMEEFLYRQALGTPSRFLGSRFQSGAPRLPIRSLPKGPASDLYVVVSSMKTKPEPTEVQLVALDSDTQLLRSVKGALPRGGRIITVETRYEWGRSGDVVYPTLIRRVEDGSEVSTVTLTSATATAKAADGTTDAPAGAARP